LGPVGGPEEQIGEPCVRDPPADQVGHQECDSPRVAGLRGEPHLEGRVSRARQSLDDAE
jgi:hypothetical protein